MKIPPVGWFFIGWFSCAIFYRLAIHFWTKL
jgi:hypothetical protein